MSKRQETVRKACAEIREYCDGRRQPYDTVMQTCANRIERIYELEMAAKDAAHQQWRDNYHAQLAAKDAEIARLKAALKPVIECKVYECDYGLYTGQGFEQTNVRSMCHNAVREAQRIMKEGESND